MKIVQADISHLDGVAKLFNQYRIFYEMPADLEASKEFLKERIEKQESVIYVALNPNGEAAGFTQLYPSFCSVELKQILYLYDLFVAPEFRRQGVGKKLIQRAQTHGEKLKVDRITLETAIDNLPGQNLYHAMGYKKEEAFYVYHLEI